MLGNSALADADIEHFVRQPPQPLEADRLGDVRVQEQRPQIGTIVVEKVAFVDTSAICQPPER